MVSRRSESTLYMQSNMIADSKEDLLQMDISPKNLLSLRMVVFLSQLNNLEIWGADVGNAYLEASTDDKLCIIAGPEFKKLQGHL